MADTTTTTYGFTKVEIGGSENTWGTKINDNFDDIDDLLDGTTPVTGIDINSGTIDNAVIGGSTPAAGTFTTLTANGNVTLGDATSDTITFTGRVASNFTPSADATYNLGGSSNQWNDLRIAGTAYLASLRLAGVDVAASQSALIADDAVNVFACPAYAGVAFIQASAASSAVTDIYWALIRYNVGSSPSYTNIEKGATTNLSTGALTGTTGSDSAFNISAHTNGLNVENRTGLSRTITVFHVSPDLI